MGKDIFEDEFFKEIERILAALRKYENTDKYEKNIKNIYDKFEENYFDFKEISNNLFDGIYISDGMGKTLFINEAYSRITGIKAEEVVGKNVKELLKKGVYKGAVTLDVIEKKKRISKIGEITRNKKEILVTGSPIFDDNGNVKMVVINNRDITELKEMGKKLEKLKDNSLKREEEIKFLRSRQISNKKIVSESPSMKSIISLIDNISTTDVTVLITGESGTGKEMIADEIYYRSLRYGKPFIKVNCAAIPSELLESELFGYVKGAFTGSDKNGKMGLFELADSGTILLDEIGDMPLNLQTKLLRVLQTKEIMKIGDTKSKKLDIRLIASTNQNLQELIKLGKFREDLYYRLNVLPINIEPLCKRKEDIEPLIQEFLNCYTKKYSKNMVISDEAIEIIKNYSWPGNIRELENFIERIIVVNISNKIEKDNINYLLANKEDIIEKEEYNLKEIIAKVEKNTIEKALKKFGSTRQASQYLKIDQSTIVKKCKKLGIKIQK